MSPIRPELLTAGGSRRGPGRGRRHGLQALPVALLAAAVAVFLVLHNSGNSAHARQTASRTHAGGADASRSSGSAAKASDPLTSTAMHHVVASRHGNISIAVADLLTRQEWLLNPRARDQTASIMKVDILETLLRHAMVTKTPLSEEQSETAQGMIEESDNDDATDLWNEDGGASGVGAYNRSAGLTQTTLNTQGFWGISLTSAADQIKLLRQLVGPGRLDGPSRRYELNLMSHIEADQDWGVSGGVPAGVSVALKNGWVPITSDENWEVNSIGRIKGDGRDYLVAVLTRGDASEQYGIDTIEEVSRLIWGGLKAG